MSLIVLDRDGVINQQTGERITRVEDWVPVPGSIEAMAQLSCAGYQLAIATNQDGLALGLFDLDDLEAIHAKLRALVEDAGGEVAAIFYCPHSDEDHCRCRKPKTGLLDAIEAEFDTSLHGSYMVGDRLKDLQVALAKGCRPVLVRTGMGEQTLEQMLSEPDERLKDTLVFDSLTGFADFVLEQT